MIRVVSVAILLATVLVSQASALVINFRIEADEGLIGPLILDFTIENDFDMSVTDSTVGLTINELTTLPSVPPIDGPVVYDLLGSGSSLLIGANGDASLVSAGTTDFRFGIFDIFTGPRVIFESDSVTDPLGLGTPVVSLLEVTIVPLPAGAALLVSALGGLVLLRRRTTRQAGSESPATATDAV